MQTTDIGSGPDSLLNLGYRLRGRSSEGSSDLWLGRLSFIVSQK